MKRFILMTILVAACGGVEMSDAEAAPSTKTAATSCTAITAANQSDARKCTVQLGSGTCTVTAGPCSACSISGSAVSVTFNQPIAPTMLLQLFPKTSNVTFSSSFNKSCSATQTATISASAADLVGTQWTFTDQDPSNPT